MEVQVKPSWTSPRVQRYGTFQEKTQYCDKMLGGSDGFTFSGAPIVCAS